MIDTTRNTGTQGVAQNVDVQALRAIMRSNQVHLGDGQIGFRSTGGTTFRSSNGFATKPHRHRGRSEPKTFFCTAADVIGGGGARTNKVAVSPGAINSQILGIGDQLISGLVNGDNIWVGLEWDIDGLYIVSIFSGHGASIPPNTPTQSYTILASVAIDPETSNSPSVVTPYAWNYSQSQACGRDGEGNLIVYYGGFGT